MDGIVQTHNSHNFLQSSSRKESNRLAFYSPPVALLLLLVDDIFDIHRDRKYPTEHHEQRKHATDGIDKSTAIFSM